MSGFEVDAEVDEMDHYCYMTVSRGRDGCVHACCWLVTESAAAGAARRDLGTCAQRASSRGQNGHPDNSERQLDTFPR